jgi:serine/threonine protein kinase
MDKWYQSLHAPEGADAPRVRVVLWDAIKALEHVHYHRIVHCDVKLANVLVELGPDGQHRGILADFDLSKDLEARRQASVSVMSFAGPRGTLGCLTMAPEVSQGAPPDDKADVFGFGGIVLQVLFSQQAEKWRECKDSERWDR